ncbi:unnamed protein product [Bursaphelenchus xylophilus]|uniref:(pine wood nematode) hypothetical protein n=1 Tax=Bursaphelenchus xylophilus TaxID=6326 RepID=A0A1I7RZE3_BURXY|nr:unnamed protein product [Bursaphelenchus xylophilus]CAG9106524.1 unnamed protein product [Bursaphelenchus xylophilus]
MPTIFELDRSELESLCLFLRPALETIRLDRTSTDRLRALITEWLLLNDLSTMHSFERREEQWVRPDKADCQSCGRYRVGRPEVYRELDVIQVTTPDKQLESMEMITTPGTSATTPQEPARIIGLGEVVETQPGATGFVQVKTADTSWHRPTGKPPPTPAQYRRHKPTWGGSCCFCCCPENSPPPRRRVPVTPNPRTQLHDDEEPTGCVDYCVMCILCQCMRI